MYTSYRTGELLASAGDGKLTGFPVCMYMYNINRHVLTRKHRYYIKLKNAYTLGCTCILTQHVSLL